MRYKIVNSLTFYHLMTFILTFHKTARTIQSFTPASEFSAARQFYSILPKDCFLRTRKTFLLSTSRGTSDSNSLHNRRRELLCSHLRELQIDPSGLDDAAAMSIKNPLDGYDGRYGKSAIKAYRSFLYPKKSNLEGFQLEAASGRCARQIEFLLKRHTSHSEEFVRHHDSLCKNRTILPLVLLLDNMRSAYNVGNIFRTADAAGCSLVITTGITPHPDGGGSEKLAKSALGAEYVVPTRHFTTVNGALEFLKDELPTYKLIGLETTERSLCYTSYSFDKESGVVVVLGNEVTGVDTRLISKLDVLLEIPMFGAKNSLNVAACAPVVLYEIIRQWKDRE